MHLPAGIWVELLNKLTARDIASIACVCTEWNKIAAPMVAQYRITKKYAIRWHLNVQLYPSYIPQRQQIYMFRHNYKNINNAYHIIQLLYHSRKYPSNPLIRILIRKKTILDASYLIGDNLIKLTPIDDKILVCDALIAANDVPPPIGRVKIHPHNITIRPLRIMEVILNVGVYCDGVMCDDNRSHNSVSNNTHIFKMDANGVCIYTRYFNNSPNIQWLFDDTFQIPLCALAFTDLTMQFDMNDISITDTRIVIRYAVLPYILYERFCRISRDIPMKTGSTDNNTLLIRNGLALLKNM